MTYESEDNGTSCKVTVTQRICVSVPIRYSVKVDPADPTIACAGGSADGTSESCRC